MTKFELKVIKKLIDKNTVSESCGQRGDYVSKRIDERGISQLEKDLDELFLEQSNED